MLPVSTSLYAEGSWKTLNLQGYLSFRMTRTKLITALWFYNYVLTFSCLADCSPTGANHLSLLGGKSVFIVF